MDGINVYRTSSFILAASLFFGCVSVKLGPHKTERSEGVRFSAPDKPFAQLEPRGADQAWKNPANGNLISYLSVCNDPADPDLETVRSEMLAALENARILSTVDRDFNGRRALSSEAEGAVDGVKTRLELLVFKKNNCTYSLTYLGLVNRFAEDRGRFQAFIDSFEAP